MTNHRCIFLPKFHPELNYIERIWGRMKYYIRLHCDNKFDTMCANIPPSMGADNLPLKLIRRYARTTFAYLYAYRDGKDIITADQWVKKHRVHRGFSKQMDNALDRSVALDSNLEQLYYPNGRQAMPDTNDVIDSDIIESDEVVIQVTAKDSPDLFDGTEDGLDDLVQSDDEEYSSEENI